MDAVIDMTVERAANAVMDAGSHWEKLKLAISKIQTCQLQYGTVIELIADEWNLPQQSVDQVFLALKGFPEAHLTTAA